MVVNTLVIDVGRITVLAVAGAHSSWSAAALGRRRRLILSSVAVLLCCPGLGFGLLVFHCSLAAVWGMLRGVARPARAAR